MTGARTGARATADTAPFRPMRSGGEPDAAGARKTD